jgi:hypothetical protein
MPGCTRIAILFGPCFTVYKYMNPPSPLQPSNSYPYTYEQKRKSIVDDALLETAHSSATKANYTCLFHLLVFLFSLKQVI